MLSPTDERTLRLALYEGLHSIQHRPLTDTETVEACISELRKLKYNHLWWGERRPRPDAAPTEQGDAKV